MFSPLPRGRLEIEVAVMDVVEAYHVEQVLAACVVGDASFRTLVLLWDEFQRLETRNNPAFHPGPIDLPGPLSDVSAQAPLELEMDL